MTNIRNIVLVKKILADGTPCRKCAQVLERLQEDDLFDLIDQVVIADERDPTSEGLRLAEKHQMARAPFFIVTDSDGKETVYDIYLKFKKAVARSKQQVAETTTDLMDLIDQHPELDYI